MINIGQHGNSDLETEVPNLKYDNGNAGIYVATGNNDGRSLTNNALNFFSGKTNLIYSAFGYKNAERNTINFNGGLVDVAHVSLVDEDNTTTTASIFNGTGGRVTNQILGLYARKDADDAAATKNEVHITNMIVGVVPETTPGKPSGSQSIEIPTEDQSNIGVAAVGARGSNGVFDQNVVEIKNSRVYKHVAGVAAHQSTVTNTMTTIENSTVNGNVFGAIAAFNTASTGNNVRLLSSTITGAVVGTAFVKMEGDVQASHYVLSKKGNSLEAEGVSTVGAVGGFDTIRLTVSQENKDAAVIHATGEMDLTDTTVEVVGMGDMVDATLLSWETENGLLTNEQTLFRASGTFAQAEWKPSDAPDIADVLSDKKLTASELEFQNQSSGANENSKTLAEAYLGSIALVAQGAEFIADEGISSMVNAGAATTFTAFGAIHSGSLRYETGSHVNLDGGSLVVGSAGRLGSFTVAGFVEAGWGSSESHVSGTTADGDHDFYGVGVATRWQSAPFYVDASARIGRASTEFDGVYGADTAKYDADGLYGSLHVGAGYTWPVTSTISANLYGRYLLTYLEGDTVGLGTTQNEKFVMDDVQAHAFRLGARLRGEINPVAGWRIGLAYEYVANGDAESDVELMGRTFSLETPTIGGNAGILELGVDYAPSETSPWSLDVTLKGYTGDRQGVTGSAIVNYAF